MKNFILLLQSNSVYFLIFGIVLIFLMILIAFKTGYFFAKLKIQPLIKDARADSVKRSKAIISGFAFEQVAPFLPNFPCKSYDCRFIGKPVDFIAFSGVTLEDEISEIVFIEVKTGNSKLSKHEKQIKSCIEQGKVRYVEYRI
ncbi:Holliday junction resolvase-like protein [Treponema pectinovorum]|uniref:Holliday junction resolvase-like protein n=1 Tax=Treponema pectinovorum TaxID=164 RepID=UPI003D8ECFAC